MTLLSLAMKCEQCGTRPNFRIFPKTREMYSDVEDDEPVKTWQCQQCGETDVITAKAYKRARAPNGAAA